MSLSREAVVGLACSVTAGPVPACRGVYLPHGLVWVWPCPAQPEGARGPPIIILRETSGPLSAAPFQCHLGFPPQTCQ